MKRRHFLGAAMLAGASTTKRLPTGEAADSAPSSDADSRPKKIYREPARQLPIVERADVVVCGAGPAGVAAAIAAARSGAKTHLIELGGCLGGVWTRGLLSVVWGASNKDGWIDALVARLNQRSALKWHGGLFVYDPEPMKLVLGQMCREAGVQTRLHTRVVDAVTDDSGKLQLVVTESKSGREAVAGKVFIDATGDGDLAALAGCGFDVGHPKTGRVQPLSMVALLAGLDPEKVAPFVRCLAERRQSGSPKARLRKELNRAGFEPSYSAPTLFHLPGGLFYLVANHEYGVKADDADAITEATLRARQENHDVVEALRSLGDPWSDLQLVVTAEQIGVREGRRIHGLYEVTAEDLASGVRFDDGICRVRFGVDIHSTDPKGSKGFESGGIRSQPYDIPMRSLIARDVRGLMMAGRCISGDFVAHSSYRVTGNSVATGEAAGVAAALAAKRGVSPEALSFARIGPVLEEYRRQAAKS